MEKLYIPNGNGFAATADRGAVLQGCLKVSMQHYTPIFTAS